MQSGAFRNFAADWSPNKANLVSCGYAGFGQLACAYLQVFNVLLSDMFEQDRAAVQPGYIRS